MTESLTSSTRPRKQTAYAQIEFRRCQQAEPQPLHSSAPLKSCRSHTSWSGEVSSRSTRGLGGRGRDRLRGSGLRQRGRALRRHKRDGPIGDDSQERSSRVATKHGESQPDVRRGRDHRAAIRLSKPRSRRDRHVYPGGEQSDRTPRAGLEQRPEHMASGQRWLVTDRLADVGRWLGMRPASPTKVSASSTRTLARPDGTCRCPQYPRPQPRREWFSR